MLVISFTRTSLISTRSLQRSEPAKSTKLSLLRSMLPLRRCSTTTCSAKEPQHDAKRQRLVEKGTKGKSTLFDID